MDLKDINALVTGANRGIGRAIALELADRGANVLAGVRADDPEHVAGVPSSARVQPVELDLGSRESVEVGLTELGPRAQGLDLLVNNAGVFTGGLLSARTWT